MQEAFRVDRGNFSSRLSNNPELLDFILGQPDTEIRTLKGDDRTRLNSALSQVTSFMNAVLSQAEVLQAERAKALDRIDTFTFKTSDLVAEKANDLISTIYIPQRYFIARDDLDLGRIIV